MPQLIELPTPSFMEGVGAASMHPLVAGGAVGTQLGWDWTYGVWSQTSSTGRGRGVQ